MYNVNFGQEDTTRPVEVETPMPEDRMPPGEELPVEVEVTEEEIPVVPEEEVILVPAAAALSRGQKIGLGVGLAAAGTVVVGGMIVAAVMKSREGYSGGHHV